MSDSVRPHRRQPTRLPRPWDSPGKNTGVGCHFLLQCRKVKSGSEVAQSCPTLSDPLDCSLPGSSVHGIFKARVLEWGAIDFSEKLARSSQLQKAVFSTPPVHPFIHQSMKHPTIHPSSIHHSSNKASIHPSIHSKFHSHRHSFNQYFLSTGHKKDDEHEGKWIK